MFSKKKVEKTTAVSDTGTHYVTQTRHEVTVQTIQASNYVYQTATTKHFAPILSNNQVPLIKQDDKSLLLPTTLEAYSNGDYNTLPRNKKPMLYNGSGLTGLDAKPFTTRPLSAVNPNYASPYRNSPVYSSFQAKNNVPSSTNFKSPYASRELPMLSNNGPRDKVVVKKTGKLCDGDNRVITYETHSKNRGHVLIINNIMFKDKKAYRNGAAKDDKNLEDLFKQMGFKVSVEKNLKKTAIESTIQSFSKKTSLKSADIMIVVVMSHGTKNEALRGTEVFGVDDEAVLTDNLLMHFSEERCKNMIGKPKIFIFQCCRGDNEQFNQTDARRTAQPPLTDMLVAYSCLPGFVSHRDPKYGTWYIQTICEVFSQHAHEYHVEDMLKMVDVQLSSKAGQIRQTTNYENMGFKRCFLHPM